MHFIWLAMIFHPHEISALYVLLFPLKIKDFVASDLSTNAYTTQMSSIGLRNMSRELWSYENDLRDGYLDYLHHDASRIQSRLKLWA